MIHHIVTSQDDDIHEMHVQVYHDEQLAREEYHYHKHYDEAVTLVSVDIDCFPAVDHTDDDVVTVHYKVMGIEAPEGCDYPAWVEMVRQS